MMNEAETLAELIDPTLKNAGWGVVGGSRIRREDRAASGLLEGGRDHRNRRPTSIGISGRLPSESPAGIVRNMHTRSMAPASQLLKKKKPKHL